MYSYIFDTLDHNFGKSNLYCFHNCPIAGISRVQDLHTNINISKLRMYAENNNTSIQRTVSQSSEANGSCKV